MKSPASDDPAVLAAIASVGPLTKRWEVYLRLEADEFGRSLPGEGIDGDTEAKLLAARLLERQGLAEIKHYRTMYGTEFVIKAIKARRR